MNSTLVDPRDYKIGPDSMPQLGVPKGRIIPFSFNASRIFPGTKRKGWIYVPRQYRRAQPAAVMIVQDGAHHMTMKRPWRLPVVFDNLIHKKEIPVSIGIFLEPGVVPGGKKGAAPRQNRSFEYDTLGDRYARFLIEEILPMVGRRYHLTEDPNGRMLLGGSSGALCSFNAAWERPDNFRRVFSCVGSYVNLRGGNIFPSLVRLSEPRPLRVFLQSGTADLDVFGGNWWAANVDMLAALKYSGYEVNHSWGSGGHDDHHGSSIFADALRWLWKDYPAPIIAGSRRKTRQALMNVLVKGAGWKALAMPAGFKAGKLVATSLGGLYALDLTGRQISRWKSGKTNAELIAIPGGPATDFCLGERGSVYISQLEEKRIVRLSPAGRIISKIDKVEATAICADKQGNLYAAEAGRGVILLIERKGKRSIAAEKTGRVESLQLNREQSRVIGGVADQRDAWVFHRAKNGQLNHAAPYFHLHLGYDQTKPGVVQIATGRQGTVYFATQSGIQLANRDGAIAGLIDAPKSGSITGVALSGQNGSSLVMACGGVIYMRPIQPDGVPGF